MANAMMVIYPYRDQGDWVFDDEAAGLKREPFVFGMPEMIDIFVKNIPNPTCAISTIDFRQINTLAEKSPLHF